MKKRDLKLIVVLMLCLTLANRGSAQVPVVSLVTGVIKKIIIAIDLKVQRLQNATLALQNAEQALENQLSLNSLNDIRGWLSRERDLYRDYYQELTEVRTVIAGYGEVKNLIREQQLILAEYKSASGLFHRDRHFSAAELRFVDEVYRGILAESLRNLEEALLAVRAFSTRMHDAERLQLIQQAAAGMQTNLDHLRQFNDQNSWLSRQRAGEEQDREDLKRRYGLP
jgi:hypothetical protein